MREGVPSRTAYGAALLRALHSELDDPVLFADPLAWPILGVDRAQALADAQPRSRLRMFVAARHRFAEDTVSAAYDRGTRQVVVLGAGLDTFAYRNPHPDLRVFEVDHPATQSWKRERVAAAGITVPGTATYVGVDFERDDLLTRLAEEGFAPAAPAVFVWLGVVPYLTRAATETTLRALTVVPEAEVVLDYAGTDRDGEGGSRLDRLAGRVAELGEAFTDLWAPEDMAAVLAAAGYVEVVELPIPAGSGGHIVHAARPR
jgi:methyltransferase (TIGR00027 family)